MPSTRPIALCSGLLLFLVAAGADSAAAGRREEGAPGAPLLLPAPTVLVEPGRGVDLAAQALWSDPERIHVLGLIPRTLLGIDPLTGIVDVLAIEGPGPFELQGPIALLSAGDVPGQVFVHDPGRLRTIEFSRTDPPREHSHDLPVTARIGRWTLSPVQWDPASGVAALVELRAAGAVVWSGEHRGGLEQVLTAQYFTRLLPGPGGRLWRVVLGMQGRADLVDPVSGTAQQLAVERGEGAWIEATTDRGGVLHLLTAGGPGSLGRRVLRFAPEPLPVLEGDRDWNTGAVDPGGGRWVAIDAEDGAILLYELP